MNFIEDMDKLIYEMKQDIKAVEKYIEQLKNDNVYWDNLTVESIVENLLDNVNNLYSLTN